MRKAGLFLQIIFYCIAGVNHFWHPAPYAAIMPPWLPWHTTLIYFTGICEFSFALLLIPARTRKTAAWLIILLLICIFPANIQMLVNHIHDHDPETWLTWVRLPIQLVLIAWAYVYTKEQKASLPREI
jgi:uncharacterized membrane protein